MTNHPPQESEMVCPTCGGDGQGTTFHGNSGVPFDIDPCLTCRGSGRIADVRDTNVPEMPKEAQGFEKAVNEALDFSDPMKPQGFWRKVRAKDAILAAHATATREAVREFAEKLKTYNGSLIEGSLRHDHYVHHSVIDQELLRWEEK